MIETCEDDGVLTVTLNRPDKANALTADMLAGVAEIVSGTDARVLIVTGAGRVFSAGMDLDAAKTDLPTSPVWEQASGAIAAFKGLSIAALNGTVAGGAMGMVVACDLRLAVPSAMAFYPVMRMGFLPQPSDPMRLTALIGPARAKMILMGGYKASAEEALAWGLFDALSEDPMAHALELAADSRAATPEHAAGIKAMVPGVP